MRRCEALVPCHVSTLRCMSQEGGGDATGASLERGSSTSSITPRQQKIQMAVVGSGPSGCFVASALTKKNPLIHVDVFERLPVPFGLCRYGVSPDHPDVKNVEKQFMELFKSDRVTWIGNIRVGVDIPLRVLLAHYAGVVFATGADSSATLDIPGRDLDGVLSASDVVSNYNTLPFPHGSPRYAPIPFHRTSRVAVIGNGNVAMDIVRCLAAQYKYFAPTDMNCFTVRSLMKNQVRTIDVLGRRGVVHSAFSIASFRELTNLEKDRIKVEVDRFSLDEAVAQLPSKNTNMRSHKRLMELVHQFCAAEKRQEEAKIATSDGGMIPIKFENDDKEVRTEEAVQALAAHYAKKTAAPPQRGDRKMMDDDPTVALPRGPCGVYFRYEVTPVQFLPSPTSKNRLGGVLLQHKCSDHTGLYSVLPCDVAIQSIGYHSNISDSVDELPIDPSTGRILNKEGRVQGMPRVYCSGWAKTGSKGVIMHSLNDAQETAKAILADIDSKTIPVQGGEPDAAGAGSAPPTSMQGKFGLLDYFVAKQLQPVSVKGLERIFHVEKARGVDLGKRLEKVSSVRDMLDIALGGEVGKKTSEEFRGISPTRPQPLLYLKELLDDETDLSSFAHALAKDMPYRLAAQHPTGPLSPSQL